MNLSVPVKTIPWMLSPELQSCGMQEQVAMKYVHILWAHRSLPYSKRCLGSCTPRVGMEVDHCHRYHEIRYLWIRNDRDGLRSKFNSSKWHQVGAFDHTSGNCRREFECARARHAESSLAITGAMEQNSAQLCPCKAHHFI